MTSRSPFQTQQFCDSVTFIPKDQRWYETSVHSHFTTLWSFRTAEALQDLENFHFHWSQIPRQESPKKHASVSPGLHLTILCAKREDQGDCNEVGYFPLKRKKYFVPDNNLISDRRWGFDWFNSSIFKDSFCIVIPLKTLAKPLVSHQRKIIRRARICSFFLLWEEDYFSFFNFYLLDFSFCS